MSDLATIAGLVALGVVIGCLVTRIVVCVTGRRVAGDDIAEPDWEDGSP